MQNTFTTNPKNKINREYKDSVFTDLFYEDENAKANELLYVSRVYESLVPIKDRYRAKTISLPKPEFFVFYNGTEDIGDGYIQKISDAFYKDFSLDTNDNSNVSLELSVKVININTNSGNEILQKCHILKEYSLFVEAVRKFKKENDSDYMQQAIEYCIKNNILAEYLSRKGSEVMNFLCAEYDYEMDIQVHEEEAYENGFEKGELSKLISQVCKKAKKSYTPEQISEQLEENLDIINKIYQLGLNTTPQYNETEILNKLH